MDARGPDFEDPRGSGWKPAADADATPDTNAAAKARQPASAGRPPKLDGEPLVGLVVGLNRREEGTQARETILEFRLERYNTEGNRVAPLAVVLRGLTIEGVLHEGDEVEIVEGRPKDGFVRARVIRNRTTGALVRSRNSSIPWVLLFLLIASVMIVAFLLVVWRLG